jgi:hypothetical protein
MRAARDLCEAAEGGSPAPGAPPPYPPEGTPPGPAPPAPGTPTIALSAQGSTLRFVPGDPLVAATGPLHLLLTNNSAGFDHSIGVRTAPGGASVGLAAQAQPGGATSLDVTLPPGSYQVYCGVGDHAVQGMVLPLTVG